MKKWTLLVALAVSVMLSRGPVEAGSVHADLEAQLATLTPGDTVSVIVEMADQVDPRAAALTAPSRDRRARLYAVVDALRNLATRTQTPLLSFLQQEQAVQRVRRFTPLWIVNGVAVTATEPVIRALAARHDIKEIRLDAAMPPPPRPLPAAPGEGGLSLMGVQWNIAQIRAPEVWAIDPRFNGSGTVVASFDTGVAMNHPDLASRYRGNHAISWFDPYGQHASPYDANGHGTHTIGTTVGGDAGGAGIGVAPGATWIAAKAWNDSGQASTSAFHKIFQWLLAPGGDPANAPDVVNGSWAFVSASCVSEFKRDVQALRAAGIFPAFAAGNSGPGAGTVTSPGAYAESFAVGATTSMDGIAAFSGRGPSPCTSEVKPDVGAPGAGVRSAVPGGYSTWSGTSMATPHVAGAVAVLRSIDPSLTVDQVESVLRETAVDLGSTGADSAFGAGRIDLYEAAQTVLGNGTGTPPPVPDLVVAALSAPGSANPGASISVSQTTKNQGTAPAAGSTTAVYLSTNNVVDAGDTLLGSRSVWSLAAGASSAGFTTVTIPASTVAGAYYVIARADADGAVAESNETNNTAATSLSISAPNRWAQWRKRTAPVFSGEYLAGDPSILRDGTLYRMFYTCLTDISSWPEVHPAICQATSSDGLAWQHATTGGEVEGLMLRGRNGQWDENLEASHVIKQGSEYLLFYQGYRDVGNPRKGYPSALGLARSTDGVRFERVSSNPVLEPTPGGYDNDAISSPTIVRYRNKWVMIYVALCFTSCTHSPAYVLAAATSDNGVSWTKRAEPILQTMPELPWTRGGVAEPGILVGPDGWIYLFFTGVIDEGSNQERLIGIARSRSPYGPWEVNPQPIIRPTSGGFDRSGVLAPDVRLEGGTVRMWYLGTNPEERVAIGYAEATWPLRIRWAGIRRWWPWLRR